MLGLASDLKVRTLSHREKQLGQWTCHGSAFVACFSYASIESRFGTTTGHLQLVQTFLLPSVTLFRHINIEHSFVCPSSC